MLKKKLKELHMVNTAREGDQNINMINQHQQIKKVQILSNDRNIENFSKRNLPELKLSKFKSRLTSEVDTDSKEDSRKINEPVVEMDYEFDFDWRTRFSHVGGRSPKQASFFALLFAIKACFGHNCYIDHYSVFIFLFCRIRPLSVKGTNFGIPFYDHQPENCGV